MTRIIAAGNLTDRVRRIPFVPHQQVPSFLRACSVVCVLEREFPIAAHCPGTPVEVLACGTPLLVSAEIARKQAFAARLVHGRNVLIVRDPRDHDELAAVLRAALESALSDEAAWHTLGMRGQQLVEETVSVAERVRPYEELCAAAIDNRQQRSVEHSVVQPRSSDQDDEEERSWAALRQPHPAVACTELLDTLFYRTIDTDEPVPASIPALAPNVVIRPFSRNMDADGDSTPCAYAFQHLPFRQQTRVVRLGLGHHRLSSLIDGQRSLGEIAAAIDPDDDSLVPRVCAAARELFDEGIIVFSTRKGAQTWTRSLTRNLTMQ